jgi:hypothetical protein
MTRLTTLQPLSPALGRLIEALAAQIVDEHLTEEAAARQAAQASRTNPVPLPPLDNAA